MRGSSPTPLLSRAWQCLKTVRVSVSEARGRRPQNRDSFIPADLRLSHSGMWPWLEMDSGPRLQEPATTSGARRLGSQLPAFV